MNPTAKRLISAALLLACGFLDQGCDSAPSVTRPTSPSGTVDRGVRLQPDREDALRVVDAGLSSAAPVLAWRCFASTSWRPADCPTRLAPRSLSPDTAIARPPPPAYFSSNVERSRVTLSWQLQLVAPFNAATSYVLEAGSASGLADVAVFDTGTPATSIYVDDVPAGIYYVRVKGRNALGLGNPSNEVVVRVGPSGPPCVPDPPTGLSQSFGPTSFTILWITSASAACQPSSYILEAGSAAGLADLADIDTGTTFSSFAFVMANVPAGAYYFRVRAASGGLRSAPTPEHVIGFAPPCHPAMGNTTQRYPAAQTGGLVLFECPPGASYRADAPWISIANAPIYGYQVANVILNINNGPARTGHVIFTGPGWTGQITIMQDGS